MDERKAAAQAAVHERRVADLLEAGTREIVRRHKAERKLAALAEPDEDFVEAVARRLHANLDELPFELICKNVRNVARAIAEVLSGDA